MTRVGLVARADNTGLGVQSWEFHRHLHPAKTLIVNLDGKSSSGKNLTIHPDRFPGDTTVVDGVPTDADLKSWLKGLDTVFTMETPYNYRLYTIARQRGIRTVLQGNWELLDYLQPGDHQDHLPDVLALPSTWNLVTARRLLSSKMKVIHLPVPIATDRWNKPSTDNETCTRFLHVVGHPAIADRNGTANLLDALRYVTSEVTLTMTCQRPAYVETMIRPDEDLGNVDLVVEPTPPENYWDLYTGHQVLVMPRRYGGLCLPVNEALGAGMPVIMSQISPNSRWLPPEWLAPAHVEDTILTKTMIDVYYTDPQALAARIDRMASDPDFFGSATRKAREIAISYSWESLLHHYQEALG